MFRYLILILIASLFCIPVLVAQVDSNCESQCNREYESSKWECSRKYPGRLEQKYYENCMFMNENNYQRCMSTCGTSL